uniref:Metallo-beta-lactamase domain-containing protein n=1 Tax=Auxenochlorella protothecoides TaxID=3075 RepID=A0A1D2A1R4_AUXPR
MQTVHPLRAPAPFVCDAGYIGKTRRPNLCARAEQTGGGPRQRRSGPSTRVRLRGNGTDHLGSSLTLPGTGASFPGPPGTEGPPLRVLPIGGLGEIGMNCMLIGVGDRYILLDAGLMFPDVTDLGMAKLLPDTSFLAKWKDKIEAVFITHGHEDHIGALPWVIPALDPNTPIFAPGFPMRLVERRLKEYKLWNPARAHTVAIRRPFQCGPFQAEAFRVTHSIPDCCGLVLRCDAGTIVHSGDWKIDETPIDGECFDRDFFEQLGKEGVTLFMSDSTNVLSAGRTQSEAVVEKALMERMLDHENKGRIITTQFASNLHRLTSVKRAADAAGRRICFVGQALHTYLEAAHQEGRAPLDPGLLVSHTQAEEWDPSKLVIVTTGSQGEPRAALSKAAAKASPLLQLRPEDLLLYSAKVIPGNDQKVMSMMNAIAGLGTQVIMGSGTNLHTSGHAYRDELEEVLRLIKPQHFLPVHGEYAFLCAHAQLARDNGIQHTLVVRNGQMVGVGDRRNRAEYGTPTSLSVVGQAALTTFYNDGDKGTGSAEEMGLAMRQQLANDGIIIAAVDVQRPAQREPRDLTQDQEAPRLRGRVRLTTRAMWQDGKRLLRVLHAAAERAVCALPAHAPLGDVERAARGALAVAARNFNNRCPEVVVIAHEVPDPDRPTQQRSVPQGLLRNGRGAGAGPGAGAAPTARGGGAGASRTGGAAAARVGEASAARIGEASAARAGEAPAPTAQGLKAAAATAPVKQAPPLADAKAGAAKPAQQRRRGRPKSQAAKGPKEEKDGRARP